MSKVWFIIGAISFISVVITLGALIGEDVIPNAPERPTFDNPSVWDYLSYPIDNLVYFMKLVPLSSSYEIVAIVLSILTLGVVWSVIEVIRGV